MKIAALFGVDWDAIVDTDFDYALSIVRSSDTFVACLAPLGTERNEIAFLKVDLKQFHVYNTVLRSVSVDVFAVAFALFYWRLEFVGKSLLIVHQDDEVLNEILSLHNAAYPQRNFQFHWNRLLKAYQIDLKIAKCKEAKFNNFNFLVF